jgi:hypothetical protein
MKNTRILNLAEIFGGSIAIASKISIEDIKLVREKIFEEDAEILTGTKDFTGTVE